MRHLPSLLVLVCCFTTSAFAADLAPPKVLGYERLVGTPALSERAAGELLLGELNCTSCHAAAAPLAERIDKKTAPILSEIGSRAKPEYLRIFLNDPATTKPTTTMPNVLATLPENERKDVVEALIHFLASTGEIEHQAPRKMNASRGEILFNTIGCVACHDPRPTDGSMPPKLAASMSLGKPSRKFALPGLAKFLEDPLAVRPSGRMPHMNLGKSDSLAIASFLLNDLEMISGMEYMVVHGSFDKLPDFGSAKPNESGEAEAFDTKVTKKTDHFAIRFDCEVEFPKEGDYDFWLSSDDGSRLYIDAQTVIDNDGIHAPGEKHVKKNFKAGRHVVAVEYFEQAGGEELKVEVKVPGGERRPLAEFITAKKKDMLALPAMPKFEVNVELATKGRELFMSLGCASCHSMKIDGTPIETKVAGKPLSQLKTEGGCMGPTPQSKTAFFPLSEAQRKAIAAALNGKTVESEMTSEAVVVRQMTRFNCLSCHSRGEIGGVDEGHDPFFQTTTKEMGDEGRLPPPLTGVGAKLKPEWSKKVIAEGSKVRPYILTKMPRFGNNLPTFHEQVAAADASILTGQEKNLAKDMWDDRKFKAAGKQLVGTQGLGCIKCHVWGDKSVPGIQAMSLTTMAERLRPEWFHPYMINPPTYRPGTRMPTAWPNGKATLPTVLGGDTNKQVQSIWAYLLDGKDASPPIGLTTAAVELVAYDEAIMYRNFIEGAGPRAIGVGYPEKLNLAFDANGVRLALIWQNGFMDASKHWNGRGAGYQPPLGDNVVKFADQVPFATLGSEDTAWPKDPARKQGYKFKGYRLAEKMRPIFQYSFGDIEAEDDFQPTGADGLFVLRRTIILKSKAPAEHLYFLAAQGNKIEAAKDGSFAIDGNFSLHFEKGVQPIARESEGKKQLLVPVQFKDGKATVVETFDW